MDAADGIMEDSNLGRGRSCSEPPPARKPVPSMDPGEPAANALRRHQLVRRMANGRGRHRETHHIKPAPVLPKQTLSGDLLSTGCGVSG